jgi:hypothetical protein
VEALGTALETLEAGVETLAEDWASWAGEAMESRGEGETNLVEGRASGMGGGGPVPAFSSASAASTFSGIVTGMLAFSTSVTPLLFFLGWWPCNTLRKQDLVSSPNQLSLCLSDLPP